jgi:hypothetical protein
MSGYTPVPAIAAGDILDEVFLMTYWVDNMAAMAPDVFSAKGQLIVGLDVDEMGVLNPGNDGEALIADSSETLGVAWKEILGELILGRQGGSSTDWTTGGTTNYLPTAPRIQIGVSGSIAVNNPSGSNYHGSGSITFPTPFSAKPIVLAAVYETLTAVVLTRLQISAITTNGATFFLVSTSAALSYKVIWLALGEK